MSELIFALTVTILVLAITALLKRFLWQAAIRLSYADHEKVNRRRLTM